MSAGLPPLAQIPSDRADGRSSWVHRALVITGLLGQIHPLQLLPAWVALVAIAAWPWQTLQLAAGLLSAFFWFVDWTMLRLLPVRHRSWGPVTPPLLALTMVRTLLAWGGAWLAPTAGGLLGVAILQALIDAVAIYATWIEPFRLSITERMYHPPHWNGSLPRKMLHISDVHFEGLSPREKALLAKVAELQPDLILISGDYLNLSSVYDPQAQAGARDVLAQLHAPFGVYAITGSPVVDIVGLVPQIFAGLDIHWLNDQVAHIQLGDDSLHLIGLRTTYEEDRDPTVLKQLIRQLPADSFKLLLYHTPDLMPIAAQVGVDLYLCGHTHGGQIRLPFYGALATSSRFGKRYEMGLYQEGSCTLYVSRGLGMEGLGAPRARFLAPPEIILWTFKAR